MTNLGLGLAEKVTVTATAEQGDPLIRELGPIRPGETKKMVLPLLLGSSIQAISATLGRSISVDYEGERVRDQNVVLEMTM